MSNPTKSAIETCENYIFYMEEFGKWYGYDFNTVCYCTHAAKEIIALLKKYNHLPPLDIISDFLKKMEKYSLKCKNNIDIFNSGIVAAEDIIDQLM